MKRKLLLILACILAANFSFAQDHHWPLDTDLKDIVGNKNGTKTPVGVSFVTDGVRGQVLSLEGNGAYVTLPVQLFKDVEDVTITCWFNYSGFSNWERVYSFGYSNVTETVNPTRVQTIYLVPRDGGGKLHVTYQATGGWTDWVGTSADSIHPGTWYFSAFVRTGDTLRFYLNDKKVAGFESIVPEDPSLLNDSMNYIGKSHWIDNTLTGMVDDLRIYKHALTEAEILALYGVTRVDETKLETPLVYSSDRTLYIKLRDNENASLRVFNILGQEVYSKANLKNLNTIDIGQSGIYIVQVKKGQQVYNSKVHISR
jgi:hypothetical protein